MSANSYWTTFQVNPIYLVGGVAGAGMMAISSVISAAGYPAGLTSGSTATLGDTFGAFSVLPGGTLIDNEIAEYPFANATTAADAVITQPLHVALEMLVPADSESITLSNRLSVITALKATLDSHIAQGGLFNVATPVYIYQNCLLTSLVDTTGVDVGGQPQVRWQWNFRQPLVTLAAAQALQNSPLAKITNQTKNAGDPPGSQPIASGIGQPGSNVAAAVVPSVTGAGAGAPTNNPTGATPINPSVNGISTQVSLW